QDAVMIQVEDDRIPTKEAPKEIKTATTKEIETAAPKEGRRLIKNRCRFVENWWRFVDDRRWHVHRWRRHVDDRWWLVENRRRLVGCRGLHHRGGRRRLRQRGGIRQRPGGIARPHIGGRGRW